MSAVILSFYGLILCLSCWQVMGHTIFQQSDQLRVHEVVFVRNIEADDTFAIQHTAEALLYLVAVCPLHHHDEISPLQEFGTYRGLGIVVGPSGRNFNVCPGRKNLFRRRAPKPVLTANK